MGPPPWSAIKSDCVRRDPGTAHCARSFAEDTPHGFRVKRAIKMVANLHHRPSNEISVHRRRRMGIHHQEFGGRDSRGGGNSGKTRRKERVLPLVTERVRASDLREAADMW